jgi:hypothetical protein
MAIHVNISYSWSGSWDKDHRIEKNYKIYFSTNPILNYEIERKSKKHIQIQKKSIKRMRIKIDLKIK